jgi:hypothetical protein
VKIKKRYVKDKVMQFRHPQSENGIDASLEFFRELETNRRDLFTGTARADANAAEAYFVNLILFAKFLNLSNYGDLDSLDRQLFNFSSQTDLRLNPKSLLSFVNDVLPRYTWTLQPARNQSLESPSVKPWILGYIYERWTNNRETGSYFTPDKLADSIVSYAVYQWLQVQSDAQFGEHESLRKAIIVWRNADIQEAGKLKKIYSWLLAVLANVRIVDLSVGGAAFLVAATKLLFQLTTFGRMAIDGSSEVKSQSILSHIFARNIFGFDLNEIATYIAKMRLWLLPLELDALHSAYLSGLPALKNLAVANSLMPTRTNVGSGQISFLHQIESERLESPLLKVISSEGGFDICVGNPPFIALSQENQVPGKTEFIADWNKRHPDAKVRTTSDLSNFFILKGAEVLRPNGVLTYITSRNFFDTRYGDSIRKFLTRDVELRHIFTLHEHPFVQQGLKVKANTVILSLVRRSPSVPIRFYHLMDWNRPLLTIVGRRVEREKLSASQNWTQTLFPDQLRESLESRCSHRLSRYARAKMGIKTGVNTFFLLKEGTQELSELEASLSPANLPKVAKNSRNINGYVLPSNTPFRLLNLSEEVKGIEKGYNDAFRSPVARHIFRLGIRYKCANCQAMAHGEHITGPEMFPHAGMCEKCPECKNGNNACDRPIDRLSAQGHSPAWYTLNLKYPPLVAVQCIVDTEIGVFWNKSKVYATDQFQVIDSIFNPELAPVLFLYLISRISHLLLEGSGMHRARYDGSFMLKIQVNHLNDLPCPDLERLDPVSKWKLLDLFYEIIDLDDRKSSEAGNLRDEVDSIFLQLLGYDQSEVRAVQEQVKSALEKAILFRWEKTTHRNNSKVETQGDEWNQLQN